MTFGRDMTHALKQLETVRHHLHMQIGRPLSQGLESAPEIALDILKGLLKQIPAPKVKNDQVIVDELEEIALMLLSGHQRHLALENPDAKLYPLTKTNPQAGHAWSLAVKIYERITLSNTHDAILGVYRDEEEATPVGDVAKAPSAPRIYVDMDGVVADFEGHFLALFGVAHNSMTEDEMWNKIHSVPDFFANMSAFEGAEEFLEALLPLNPTLLSACPERNYAEVAMQKRVWKTKYPSKEMTLLPVRGGATKPLFMHAKGDILIDDYPKYIEIWRSHGGVGILHTSFERTLKELAEILRAKNTL